MPTQTFTASDTYLIARVGDPVGVEGLALRFVGSAFTGSIVLRQNQAPPGSALNLVSVGYRALNSDLAVAAGTAITGDATVIVSDVGYDLYAVATVTAGTMALRVSPANDGLNNRALQTAREDGGYQNAGQQSFPGQVASALADLLGQSLDVRAFGAVGDGVTDDGAAINAAIAALPATGGSVVFPPGDYMTSVTIAITKPGVRLVGSNGGSWRAGAFSQVPALTSRSTTNIIGTTASMTVVQCNGVGNLGALTEQAGPVIENISIWDNAGRIAGEPGTMTLLHLRMCNRWTVRNVGLFWGLVGAKLQKGTSGDCAGWLVQQAFVTGCATGGIIDTFSGLWQGGWISLCGIGLDCDLTEGANNPSSLRISDLKMDIMDPSEDATYAPGVGIQIGEVVTTQISRCTFENQPGALAAPTTTAILINPANSQTTRVELNDCVTVEHDFGVDCEKALFLKINGHIHRTRNSGVGGTAAIRITSCTRATIAQSISREASDIPIQLDNNATDVTITDTDADVELI